MSDRVRILIVEDSSDDAELNINALRSEGLHAEWIRVETETEYLSALDWPPDIILSDYSMPKFGAIRALQLLRASDADIPFIVVSGTVGEDTAVALMRAGAHDYVIKSNIARLAPAVSRELRESKIRSAERAASTALQESEARYRRIVETAEEGVWMVDAESNTSFVNTRMAEMLGYTVDEMQGRPVYEFINDSERHAMDRYLERLRNGLREQHDFQLRHKNGTYLWAMVSVSLVFGPGHSYAGALAMVTDITQRKQAEHAVQTQERLMRLVLDTLPVGVVIIDAAGNLLSANPAAKALWGGMEEPGIWRNRKHQSWLLSNGKQLEPEDWASIRAVTKGETTINEVLEIECFDGLRRIIHNSAVPIRNEQHEIMGAVIVNADITEHKHAEQLLRERESLLQAIVEAEPECVKLLDSEGCVVQMNAAGLAMFEADNPAQVIGKPAITVVTPDYRERFQDLTKSVLEGNSGEIEFEIIGLKGTRRWLETHAVPLKTGDGNMLLGVTRDITVRKQAEQRLTYLANYNPTTGLANRTLLLDRLQRAIIDAAKRGRLVGVVSLDIMRFNAFNDTLGHEHANNLLQVTAERLSVATRKGDTVSHLGGDEFMVLLTDIAAPDDVPRVVQKILNIFERPVSLGEHDLFLTLNMGISIYPYDEHNAESLIRTSQLARHRAKENGDGRYHFYAREMTLRAESTMKLEHDLRQAIEHNELRLHYQPVVDAGSGHVLGFEALIRWMHPDRGLVSPAEFIPLAEEMGLIVPIGAWVIHEACSQIKLWRSNRLQNLHMAVNISTRQFQHSNLADTIDAVLKKTNLEPEALVLEITESALMNATEQTRGTIDLLRSQGISFSLDDFGTGYSSFSYLKQLPIDTLKIDKTFIDDIPGNVESEAIVRAMVVMSHALGKRVVAEGVETQIQRDFLCGLGVDEIQGYFYGAPMESTRIEQWLMKSP